MVAHSDMGADRHIHPLRRVAPLAAMLLTNSDTQRCTGCQAAVADWTAHVGWLSALNATMLIVSDAHTLKRVALHEQRFCSLACLGKALGLPTHPPPAAEAQYIGVVIDPRAYLGHKSSAWPLADDAAATAEASGNEDDLLPRVPADEWTARAHAKRRLTQRLDEFAAS